MALFTDTQPSTQFWTAPKSASGSNLFKLALTGKKADGSNNVWGEIGSWIPGLGLAQQYAAQKVAADTGISDVKEKVDADMDNRLAKLQAGLSAGQAVAGALTANPSMIASGLGGITSAVGTGMGADAADKQFFADAIKRKLSYQ